MSCNRWLPGALVAVLLVPLGLSLVGCGKKGPPMPPLRFTPKAAEDLTVAQKGRELAFELSFPSETTSGAPMPTLQQVELWALTKPAPEEGTPDPVNPRELDASATRVQTLRGDDLREATVGGKLAFRVPLPDPEPRQAFFFAVKSVVSERDTSELSNQAVIVPTPPPPAPRDLTVTPMAEGVEVGWTLPDVSAFEDGEPPEAFHVYRRDPRNRFWGEPLKVAGPSDLTVLDETAEYGQSYIYTVTSVMSLDPLLESPPGGEREIAYRDLFAPAPPRDPVALPEAGQVRLVWEASPAPDVAGYHVDRRSGAPGAAEDWQRLTADPVPRREYLDRGLAPATAWIYRISAVDGEGNEGEPSAEVRAETR